MKKSLIICMTLGWVGWIAMSGCQDPLTRELETERTAVPQAAQTPLSGQEAALSPTTCVHPKFRNNVVTTSCTEIWSHCLIGSVPLTRKNGISWKVGTGCNVNDTYPFLNGPVNYAVYRRNGSSGTCARFDLIGSFSCSYATMNRASALLTNYTECIIAMNDGPVYLGSIFRSPGSALFTASCGGSLYLVSDTWTFVNGAASGNCGRQ